MADGNQVRREPPVPITEAEKARRRDIVSRSDHSAHLEGGKRSDLGKRAAELWAEGKITAEEKREMLIDKYRQVAASNGIEYDG